MYREFFWQDLWLGFWWNFSNKETIWSVFYLVCAISFFYMFYRLIPGISFTQHLFNTLLLLSSIVFIIFFIATMLSNWVYPYVYANSPNTQFKESLQTIEIAQGDTVWCIKRNEHNKPIEVEEHVVFAKKSDSIIVDQTLDSEDTHSSNYSNAVTLVSIPLSDCYASKDDAYAALEED